MRSGRGQNTPCQLLQTNIWREGREKKAIPTSSLTPRRLGYQPALSTSLFTEAATQLLLAQLPGYRTCCGGCHGNSQRAGTGCQQGSQGQALSCCSYSSAQSAAPNIRAYLDGETQDLDPHATHVGSCHLPHQLGKLVPVLVDLLHCQGTCRGEEGEELYLEQVTRNDAGLSSATSSLSLISSGLGIRA